MIRLSSEDEIQRRVPTTTCTPDSDRRLRYISLGKLTEKVNRIKHITLADPIVTDKASERSKPNAGLLDTLEVLYV